MRGFVDPFEQRVRALERENERRRLEQTWIREQLYKLKAQVDDKVQIIPFFGRVNEKDREQ